MLVSRCTLLAELGSTVQESPGSSDGDAGLQAFREAASGANLVPLFQRILSDHLTPVLAYRCLVREDELTAGQPPPPPLPFEALNKGDLQASPHKAHQACCNCLSTTCQMLPTHCQHQAGSASP